MAWNKNEKSISIEIENAVFRNTGCYFISISSLQSEHKNVLSTVRTEVSEVTDKPKFKHNKLTIPLKTDFTHANITLTAFYIEREYADLDSEESIGLNKARNIGSTTINLTPHSPYLLTKKTVTLEEHFIKKRKVKFEELTSNLENLLKNQACNAAFEDYLLTINSSRYLHFFQDMKTLMEKKSHENTKFPQFTFRDIEEFYDTYISASASQHLLTEVWVKKHMFEILYMKLETLKLQPKEKTIDCSIFEPVVNECWHILLEKLHPSFVSSSKEYQELKETLDSPVKGLYDVIEETGNVGISMKQAVQQSLNDYDEHDDSLQFDSITEGGNQKRKGTFHIGIRSARNIYKFGLPEESKRPEVVPVKVEVRFIDKSMKKKLEHYRETIQQREILSRKKNILESMRRDLDISISDPSLTTSKIMRDENPIWNENLTCKVDDVLLHGAYEYIRFDFVENCDERWPSLGGFHIPLKHFHVGLQYDLRVVYDMTRRDYGHEMEPMTFSVSIETRNSHDSEVIDLVDNENYAIRAQLYLDKFDIPMPMDYSHVMCVTTALGMKDFATYKRYMEAAVQQKIPKPPTLPFINIPIKSRIALWDGPDFSMLSRDEERYGTKKGKQKSSLMNSIPSANSICKFQTSATFDSTDMPVAFGVSYFGRRRNQRQFKYIGYSIIRIPGDNDIDGSIHKFEHVRSYMKSGMGENANPNISGAYRIWNAPHFLDEMNSHGIDPFHELRDNPLKALSNMEATDWSQMTFNNIPTNKDINEDIETSPLNKRKPYKKNNNNNEDINRRQRQPSKPTVQNNKIGESPRTTKMFNQSPQANNNNNNNNGINNSNSRQLAYEGMNVKTLGRELLKDNSKLPTHANQANDPSNWFVPEVTEGGGIEIPDEKWINRIRDPKWKSKLQAIHGDMTSDVDSMENILEAAMAHKDKSAMKNKNSDAAMALWKHAAMYPDLNRLPTTKQELYRQLVKTRAELKKTKEDNVTISALMSETQHQIEILRHDKDHLNTQLSMVTARRDAVIIELKLARKRMEKHKATVRSAAVDAVSLRVKVKEAHQHKSTALRAMEHEKSKRERVEQHARELKAAQEAMEQASARQAAAASSALARTSTNVKKSKIIEKERLDLAVKSAVEAAVAKVKHDFVIKEHKEHAHHEAVVHDYQHKLDNKVHDLIEANRHIKRLENELHELRMKNVTAELAMMEVQLGMENTVSQKDQDVAFSVAGY